MKVTTVEQMRNMDRRAIEEFGVPDRILMENAGLAAYEVIRQRCGVRGRRFLVLCGTGNNGGDGLVVARKLYSTGGKVRVMTLGGLDRYEGSPKDNLEMLQKAGVPIDEKPPIDRVRDGLDGADCVIDALFGTGISREVEGLYRDVIEEMNARGVETCSIDIPSGVNGDNGKVLGVAVRAHFTVTFGLPKLGNLLYPGAGLGGDLYVTHISFPPQIHTDDAVRVEMSVPSRLPGRKPDGHKTTFGDVLFVAGAAGYFGAPTFSALSFMKAGGGYSRLAAPRSVVPQVATMAPEVVFLPQKETEEGSLSFENIDGLLEWGEKTDLAVVGPGLSLAEETQKLVLKLVSSLESPVLLDGDGLTAVSKSLDVVKARSGETILTPHPGEMARICDCSIGEVKESPVSILQKTCRELSAHIVLKGAHSLVGAPDGRVYINTTGNSGMASAGSGDVLCGAIAAMYGLGLTIEEAVRTGVFVHGMAGDLAADHRGPDGVTAPDILQHLPEAVTAYRANYLQITEDYYGTLKVV